MVGRKVHAAFCRSLRNRQSEHQACQHRRPEAIQMFRVMLAEHQHLQCHPPRLSTRPTRRFSPIPTITGSAPYRAWGRFALTILAEAGDLRRFPHHRQFLVLRVHPSTQQSGQFAGQVGCRSMGMRDSAMPSGWRRMGRSGCVRIRFAKICAVYQGRSLRIRITNARPSALSPPSGTRGAWPDEDRERLSTVL